MYISMTPLNLHKFNFILHLMWFYQRCIAIKWIINILNTIYLYHTNNYEEEIVQQLKKYIFSISFVSTSKQALTKELVVLKMVFDFIFENTV